MENHQWSPADLIALAGLEKILADHGLNPRSKTGRTDDDTPWWTVSLRGHPDAELIISQEGCGVGARYQVVDLAPVGIGVCEGATLCEAAQKHPLLGALIERRRISEAA